MGRHDAVPLSRGDLDSLASYLRVRSLGVGQRVAVEGQEFEGVVVVQDGLLECYVGSGRRREVVQLLRPGDVDGDVQLLLDVPASYSVRTVVGSKCLYFSREDFERLMREHPTIAKRWMTSIAKRLTSTQRRLFELLGRSVPQQAARLILEEETEETVALPQRTLAAMLGVHRATLNKVLGELESEGLIKVGYRQVRVRDRRGLERLAGPR